ncbi:FadR/GntR family transcriptional regulator [Microlunatus sp. GCM10028923]|uniref:FadR/GntR family transcriptional regulator n=1 Tax=Microlunatus sp. GCM10028923 TaxID=3273400 RepID=UPI003607161A
MAESLTQRVVGELTREIADGVVAAGERLPTEAALMQRFSVSRTVVREAVARLRAAGLVDSQQGRGTYVLTRPSGVRFEFGEAAARGVPELLELAEFRIGVECEAAALAARRRDDQDLVRLRKAVQEQRAAVDAPSRSIQADFDFHHGIARASRNRYYADLLSAIGPMMIILPKGRRKAGRPADPVGAEHDAILTAIDAGDPQAASAAMRTHLINSAHRLRRE